MWPVMSCLDGVSTMFPGTYAPRYLCSPVPMFPEPMFPGTYVPRFTANMLDVVIGNGIPSELFDKQFRCVNGRAYIAETQTHTHARTNTHTKKIDGPFTTLNVPFSDGTLPY